MRADVLERLSAIARGEIAPVPAGTPGTHGTAGGVASPAPGTLVAVPDHGPIKKGPLFQVFRVFRLEHDEFGIAERAAIAMEEGRVPMAYADAWAVFQTRKPGHLSEPEWFRAMDDAGRFLDEWAALALDFGWRPSDFFRLNGLAWFCAGERVRALGPDIAITASGRVFTRQQGKLRNGEAAVTPTPGSRRPFCEALSPSVARQTTRGALARRTCSRITKRQDKSDSDHQLTYR